LLPGQLCCPANFAARPTWPPGQLGRPANFAARPSWPPGQLGRPANFAARPTLPPGQLCRPANFAARPRLLPGQLCRPANFSVSRSTTAPRKKKNPHCEGNALCLCCFRQAATLHCTASHSILFTVANGLLAMSATQPVPRPLCNISVNAKQSAAECWDTHVVSPTQWPRSLVIQIRMLLHVRLDRGRPD